MTTKPLVLVLYSRLMPGGQLLGRLEDLGYRVQSLSDPGALVATAEREKPMFIIADFEPQADAVARAVATIKSSEPTAHLPVIGLVATGKTPAEAAARDAGANLVVQDTVILQHLAHFIDQALSFD